MNDAIVRPPVRVLLIDSRETILLFASVDDSEQRVWFPPGGGIDPGETPEQAAYRELREETGLTELPLDGLIGSRQIIASFQGTTYDFRETWFLAWVPSFSIDITGHSDLEQNTLVDHRWWTLAELELTAERLVPRDLANLVRKLISEGLSTSPIVLGP